MRKLSTSIKIYIVLILTLGVSNAIQVLLPSYQSLIPSTAELPAPIPVLALANFGIAIFIYGGLGLAGLTLARKVGFPEIWDEKVSNRQRFLAPAIIGALGGIFLIIADLIFSRFNGIGRFTHPAFPGSIFASLSAGIGEELLFRLFLIPLWMWLISRVMLKKTAHKEVQSRLNRDWRGSSRLVGTVSPTTSPLKGEGRGEGDGKLNTAFWISNIVSAIAFGAGHFPALMLISGFKSFGDIPPVLIFEVILLNGVISILAAYYMRKWGFLAAAGIHFWTDIVWHVVWGLF